ncbi:MULTISPECIES: CvfB family protein [Rikenellaceae]|uniref:S1 motif domain-containing protein n=1 Tax=Alistipes inops TaxID=1501391 RepID=A0ABR4YIV3_9BACT|nr:MULTISPECIES: S1-like domain-containing RNA-binding protein [Rikenellaceae]KHE41588.1 hypothetical protein LG35_08390 [Alistipes inops]
MLQAGSYHTLTVNRISDYGLYLADEEGNEVLLPNRYVSLADRIGDTKEVFVYHDTENRLTATTERPYAAAGETAFLEVVDKNLHGAFLAWGITAKDLFVPNSNQSFRMEPGKRYVVFVYRDNLSGRVVATTKLNGFISNESVSVRPRQRVDILVARRIPVGYRVVIENRHWGVLYDNQLFRPIHIGDRLEGYVNRITEEGRIDISLQRQGFDEVKDAARRLALLIDEAGGTLPLHDKSSPEKVATVTGMSKKVFKRALGHLLSHGAVYTEDGTIKAIKKKG